MPTLCVLVMAAVMAMSTLPAQAKALRTDRQKISAPSPAQALSEAAKASRTDNFEGVLVYRRDGAIEVMHVVHRYRNGRQSEHLLTLTGEPRELVRRGDDLICILPSNGRLILQQPSVKGFLSGLNGPVIDGLTRWYRFRNLGTTRVAGRQCMGVAVEPRDKYRYGYQVWLDAVHHLPLRVVLMGGDHQVLEQVMFTEVHFPSRIPDSAFTPRIAMSPRYKLLMRELGAEGKARTSKTLALGQEADVQWRFGNLPPGFRVVLRDQRDMPDGLGYVQHMLISDGLSSVSVFASKIRQSNPGLLGLSQMGSVHAYGRTVGNYHITVVGEAPARTVRMIGNAIERAGDALPAAASVASSGDSDLLSSFSLTSAASVPH